MTRLVARLRRRLVADESGASLPLVLALIAVFSVIIAAILSLTDTGFRVTMQLRAQASESAAADGAAQIAINNLRKSGFIGTGDCLGTSNTLRLDNFYPHASGPADSAVVTCTTDVTRTSTEVLTVSAVHKPSNAVLTTGRSVSEIGLDTAVGAGRSVTVHGPVFVNSNINVGPGSLVSESTVTARTGCTGTVTATPAPNCTIGNAANSAGDTPTYALPPAPAVVSDQTPCDNTDNTVIEFEPGRYWDRSVLNSMTASRCENSILHFRPGVYYFDFADNVPWSINNATIVGGTPTSTLNAAAPPAMPGSCVSPFPPKPDNPAWSKQTAATAGVQLVFAGSSRISLTNTRMEICGTYSATGPAIAIYGLTAPVGSYAAQDGCVAAAGGCPVITARNSVVHIQGTTFVPRASLDLEVNNTGGLLFSAGVVARQLRVAPTAAASLTSPIIELPDDSVAFGRTQVLLNVYLCPGQPSCTTSTGAHRLRAKVDILDPTGTVTPGAREIRVLSWSLMR